MAPNDFHHSELEPINTRTILPLLPSDPSYPNPQEVAKLPKPSNLQGDIYLLLPKSHENLIFFTISNVTRFKQDLASYKPTTSEDVINNLRSIAKAKKAANGAQVRRVPLSQTQIAFSRAGLNLLGKTEEVKDAHFDKGPMRTDKTAILDKDPWDSYFDKTDIHGVIMVCSSDADVARKGTDNMKSSFKSSITNILELDGNVRPGENKGHEHFGWEDGVSQPALRGLVKPHKGQLQCDPGVIIMGYKGDTNFDDTTLSPRQKRPAWTRDGSLMVFKKLEQDVLRFENYNNTYGPRWREYMAPEDVALINPPLTDEEGITLLGSRLIGRWPRGTPMSLAPYRRNSELAKDPEKNNDFDYSIPGVKDLSPRFCPFYAHTRKVAPRNLDPYIDKKFFESALMVRGGLPYGPEITDAERKAGPRSTSPRGLLFVGYQSSIQNGFFQQSIGFANNTYWPLTSIMPSPQGIDPVLASYGKNAPPPPSQTSIPNLPQVVTSRGGEYFFVPSVALLKELSTPGAQPQSSSQSGPPTKRGVYRIKLAQRELYWELVTGGNQWVKLGSLDKSNLRQQWTITPLGNDRFHINNAFDGSGLVASTYGYWGYGFIIPDPRKCDPFTIDQQTAGGTTFSKIWNSKKPYPLDSYNDEVVHFYSAKPNAANQRWVFEEV